MLRQQLHPSPARETRRILREERYKSRRFMIDYDLAYDGGGGKFTVYYRTQLGARVCAFWNVHIGSWGGTAVLTDRKTW